MVFFRALTALINFNCLDQPHLVPPPTPMSPGAHLSSARSLHSFLWAVLGHADLQLSHWPADPDLQPDFPAWPRCDIALWPGLLVGPGCWLQVYWLLLLRYYGKGLWLVRDTLPTIAAAPLAVVSLLAACPLESSQLLLLPDNIHGLDDPCGHTQLLGGMRLWLPLLWGSEAQLHAEHPEQGATLSLLLLSSIFFCDIFNKYIYLFATRAKWANGAGVLLGLETQKLFMAIPLHQWYWCNCFWLLDKAKPNISWVLIAVLLTVSGLR